MENGQSSQAGDPVTDLRAETQQSKMLRNRSADFFAQSRGEETNLRRHMAQLFISISHLLRYITVGYMYTIIKLLTARVTP